MPAYTPAKLGEPYYAHFDKNLFSLSAMESLMEKYEKQDKSWKQLKKTLDFSVCLLNTRDCRKYE